MAKKSAASLKYKKDMIEWCNTVQLRISLDNEDIRHFEETIRLNKQLIAATKKSKKSFETQLSAAKKRISKL